MMPFCCTCVIYTLDNETNLKIYQDDCRPTASLNLSSCDLMSNNHRRFLTYLGTTHLSPLTVSILQKRCFQYLLISNMLCHRNFKKFSKCKFPLKLSREVVVCIEGMAFVFITYSFYFIYFYFILLFQKNHH